MADLDEGLLIAAGNKLLEPPASVDKHLALLQVNEDASLGDTRRGRLAPLLEDILLLKEVNKKILQAFSSRKCLDDERERKLHRLERLEEELRHFEQLETGVDRWRAKVIWNVCLISAIGVGVQVMTGVGLELLLKHGRK